jgi:hypothetical protein
MPSHGGSLNLSYSTQTRLHQLLQVQHLHERLWKTRRYTLRKRMRKERKWRQQTGHSGFSLRFAISSSNSDFFIFAYKIFSILKLLVLICLLTMAVYSLTTWRNCSTLSRQVQFGRSFKRLNYERYRH